MGLKKWKDIPVWMKNDNVKLYYDILNDKRMQLMIKRIFDLMLSFVLIILCIPLFMILAILIKLDSKGTIFYRQERVTQYGRIFKIFKFRTMISNADIIGTSVTVKHDSRITNIGKKIRSCRLDEVPQLFNVFLGDMSFVGVRPEIEKYVKQYTDEMNATLLMPAGVTSLASIQFKNESELLVTKDYQTIDEVYCKKILPAKMKINLDYLRTFNIFKDLKICIMTLGIGGYHE